MKKLTASILIVDDDPGVLTSAKIFLKQKFSMVSTLPSPENIEKIVEETSVDLVLLDMNYQKGENDGREGLDIIDRLVRKFPGLEILPVTAYGEIDLAVEAMKRGARDFITKPWQNEKLLLTITNVLNLKAAKNEIATLKAQNNQLANELAAQGVPLIGESTTFRKMLDTISKVAPTDANVLITGENGTGKELVAQAIHNQSLRHDQVMQKVDLGSLSASLFESELFGHVKGAFTDAKENRIGKFEMANGSTLFLDEIGNIDGAQQSKLLTAIQSKSITRIGSNKPINLEIRLVCATNANLMGMVNSGEFRQDLLYRINTIEIEVPSLRERIDDIPALTDYYFDVFKKQYKKPQLKLSRQVYKSLSEYHWPGNIRELTHVVERAVILSEGPLLTPANFNLMTTPSEDNSDNLNLQEMEKSLILKSLEKNKGNITHAAKDLGIDRLALYRRLEKYGL